MPLNKALPRVAERRRIGGAGGRVGGLRISTPNNRALTNGRRTNVQLKKVGDVTVDEEGFEIVDEFWSQEGEDKEGSVASLVEDGRGSKKAKTKDRGAAGLEVDVRNTKSENRENDPSLPKRSGRVTPNFDYRKEEGERVAVDAAIERADYRTPIYKRVKSSRLSDASNLSGVSTGSVPSTSSDEDVSQKVLAGETPKSVDNESQQEIGNLSKTALSAVADDLFPGEVDQESDSEPDQNDGDDLFPGDPGDGGDDDDEIEQEMSTYRLHNRKRANELDHLLDYSEKQNVSHHESDSPETLRASAENSDRELDYSSKVGKQGIEMPSIVEEIESDGAPPVQENAAHRVEFQGDYDDNDDDDEGGHGFQIADQENSLELESVVEPVVEEKKQVKEKKKKDKKKSTPKKRKKLPAVLATVDPFDSPIMGMGRNGVNGFGNVIPVSDYKTTPHDTEEGLRRSRRAKFPPLQYWKNEHLIFEANHRRDTVYEVCDMPVVTGVFQALPTPLKQSKKSKDKSKNKEKQGKESGKETKEHDVEHVEPFDGSKLKEKYRFVDGNSALVWDEGHRENVEKKIVSFSSDMRSTTLPMTAQRGKRESKIVGLAAQAFNTTAATDKIPGWISGNLTLPPRGIKDPEGVGVCSQVFFVGKCQPNSLELALADPNEQDFDSKTAQRFLLSYGDFFHVPPNNIYRVENHSKDTTCSLYWTIVRPLP